MNAANDIIIRYYEHRIFLDSLETGGRMLLYGLLAFAILVFIQRIREYNR